MSDDSIPDWDTPATPDDLRWWFDKAPTLKWTWAKTFANSAPHWYVHDRTPGMTTEDFHRVGRVIRTFGEPGKFWRRTNLYLFTPDRARKFWSMWADPPTPYESTLVNLAFADQVYGPQTDFDEEWLSHVRLTRNTR